MIRHHHAFYVYYFYDSTPGLKKKMLKKDAVPSIFWTKNCENKEINTTFVETHLCSTTAPLSSSCVFDNSEIITNESNELSCEKQHHSVCPSEKKFKQVIKMKDKKIKRLQKKVLRQAKSIKGLMKTLNEKELISKEFSDVLGSNFGHIEVDLFKNEVKNRGLQSGSRYSNDIKEFAVSLHFYSPRAYKFVRKTLHLPHPATLRSWAGNVVCEPGFLSNAIKSFSTKLQLSGENECALIVDEMSIRTETKWDRKLSKFVGNVDYGNIKGENQENMATNVLVVMAVGLKAHWKIPIAYFLTNRTNSEIQAQIIKRSITLLYNESIIVKSVTFDGPTKNIATARKLGCKIDDLQGSFPHPCRPDLTVYVILDICHMLKLARNALGDMKVFLTPKGEKISWEFLEALYKIQQQDILHIGNLLKTKHMQWQKHKMNVSVAAQTLSCSVASAITFLRENNVAEFQDSIATTEFILLMNNLFDILNSKSKFGRRYKAPISLGNYSEICKYLTEGIDILKSLTDADGVKIISGPRKTFVQGFAISVKCLEMFFSKVRGRLGWNNNPNALQFKYALRALLLKNKVECPATANCTEVEGENNLKDVPVSSSDEPDSCTQSTDEQEEEVSSMLTTSTTWRADVLFYIAGFIASRLYKTLKCPECAAALFISSDEVGHQTQSISLISCKQYGKLFVPSSSVVKVTTSCDTFARQELLNWTALDKKKTKQIIHNVLVATQEDTFASLYEHSKECHVLDINMRDENVTRIKKLIAESYLRLFLHQFGKVYTERVIKKNKTSRRHQLTKQVLFLNE